MPNKPYTTLVERFWKKVWKAGENECWFWCGAYYHNGYGHIYVGTGRHDRKTVPAHRVAFYLTHNYWPKEVRHSCDKRNCVNPKHLIEGTRKENMQDAVARGRISHGKNHYAYKHGRYSKYTEAA